MPAETDARLVASSSLTWATASVLTNNDSIDPQTIVRTLLRENPELLGESR